MMILVLFDIVHDMIVLDIAQHCHILSMQCCVQYWLSAGPEANCTHCTRILHEFHFIVSTAQNCTKSFKIQFSHGTGIKFVVVWSSLQIMRPRRRSGSDLNLPVTVDGRSARRGRLSRSQTLLSCDGGPPARRRGPTASAAAESPCRGSSWPAGAAGPRSTVTVAVTVARRRRTRSTAN